MRNGEWRSEACGQVEGDAVERMGRSWAVRGLLSVLLSVVALSASLPFFSVAGAEAPDAGSLWGRVTLGEQGLAGATITLAGPADRQIATSLDGSYQFSDLPAGTYTLALSEDGFQGSPPLRTVLLPGPEIRGLDFAATPIASMLPTVRLIPSASRVHPGDTFTLRLTLAPGSREPVADLYLIVAAPGASLRPAPPWQTALLVPMLTEYPVFSHTLTGAELPGTYTWFAFLTRPGTQDLLGPVASAAVTVEP